MAPSIVTTGSSWVEPAGPVVEKIITCSATENQCAQVYPTALWLWQTTKDSKDPMTHYDMLKKGLARTLYEQPILGGTLQQDDTGRFSVEIPPAPRAGARFYFRDLSSDASFPSYTELASGNFPVIDFKHDGLEAANTEEFPGSQAGEPTFLAQLTVIRGGLLLSGSWTHLIGDLLQPRACAVSWAQQTKLLWDAQAAGLPEPALPTPFPNEVFDRTRLLPQVEEMSFEDVQAACDKRGHMFVFNPTDPEKTAELMANVFPRAHLKANEVDDESKLRVEQGGMLRIPLAKLKELQAIAQGGSKQKLSAVNVIIGWLWQRFYMAKYGLLGEGGLAETELTQPAIVFPGDVRSRLDPPLPPTYLGAAVDLFKAEVKSVKAFLPENNSTSALSRSLGVVASAVRNGSSSIDGVAWSEQGYMDLLRLFMATPVSVPFLPRGPLEFLVTDHTHNAPMRLCNWGSLGVSHEYRQPYAGRDLPQGEITIMPRHANGDIEVMLTAESVTMQRLFKDPVILQFATPLYLSHNVMEAVTEKRARVKVPTARL